MLEGTAISGKKAMDVFVSVGTGLNQKQEAFVSAIENRLRAEGLNPCTVGRNTFSIDTPLKTVTNLMDRCEGTMVIALERYFSPHCVERRGGAKEAQLEDVSFPTTWNQIEAAMAYCRGHPLLVIVDRSIKTDGLLEPGNDWFVQLLDVDPDALNSNEFNGVFTDWRDRVKARIVGGNRTALDNPRSPAEMSLIELLGALRPGQAWKLGCAVVTILGAAFAVGAKFFG